MRYVYRCSFAMNSCLHISNTKCKSGEQERTLVACYRSFSWVRWRDCSIIGGWTHASGRRPFWGHRHWWPFGGEMTLSIFLIPWERGSTLSAVRPLSWPNLVHYRHGSTSVKSTSLYSTTYGIVRRPFRQHTSGSVPTQRRNLHPHSCRRKFRSVCVIENANGRTWTSEKWKNSLLYVRRYLRSKMDATVGRARKMGMLP